MDDVVLWHERDISHSSVERVIGPDAVIAVHFMLVRLHGLLAGLRVLPGNMRRNIERTGGIFTAQRVMLALVEQGLSREDAYGRVQRCAMRAWTEERPLHELLAADPHVTSLVDEQTLAGLSDPAWYVRRVGAVLDRVFAQRSAESPQLG